MCLGEAQQRTTRVEVVGTGQCADCEENNVKTTHAFSGVLSLILNLDMSLLSFVFTVELVNY